MLHSHKKISPLSQLQNHSEVAISKSPSRLSPVSVNNAALQQSGLQVNTPPAAPVSDLKEHLCSVCN